MAYSSHNSIINIISYFDNIFIKLFKTIELFNFLILKFYIL